MISTRHKVSNLSFSTRKWAFLTLLLTCICISPRISPAEIQESDTIQAIESQQSLAADEQTGDSAPPLSNVEKPRGQLLYDNHCHVCHESNVHIRANRKAKSKKDILYWVNRWSDHLKLKWNSADKNDVATYLNMTYYHYQEDVVE